MKNVILKPIIAFFISCFVSLALAIPASLTLDGLLQDRGLPGAIGGLFYGGIADAISLGILGGIAFGYVFGLHENIAGRVALGVILGVIGGVYFAAGYLDESFIQLLGVITFCAYGALWGGIGGGIFALVIGPIYSRLGLTSRNQLSLHLNDKSLLISSAVTVTAALIPLAFSAATSSEVNVHIVVASERSCNDARKIAEKFRLSLPVGVYSPRVVYSINGTYAVSIAMYGKRTGKKALVAAVKSGVIPSDSILVAERDILKDNVACN